MSLVIHRKGDRPETPAPAAYFTGDVTMEPIIRTPEPASLRALRVTFAPGARTNWHHHPLGQTLHVTEGTGLVALRGEAPVTIGPGDTVFIPPHVEHWHGATSDHAMTHFAMQEEPDGETTWLEPVSDTDYTRTPTA